MKPKTGFELILNYSSQCHEKKLKNDSSVGANAASRVNTKFSACDPLSEIVWSPDKGYSLKCVDSSFTNKNTSLFQDVEPSSMVLALLQSVTCTTDKPIDDVFVQPLAVICTKSDVSSSDTPVKHPTSYSAVIIPECKPYQEHDAESGANLEKMNSARGTPNLANYLKENLMSHWEKEKNICAQANIETAKICKIMEKENKSSTISGRINRRPLGSLLVPESESKPSMEQNPSPRKHCKEGMDARVEHMIEDKGSGTLGTYLISSGTRRSKKMELTAEKELKNFNFEATSAAKSRIRVLKEENDCHLSCENYHSTELFLSSRKRCKQQVIIGSKKVKMEIQETSYSKSYVKRDSSLMSLFPNMMKGYSQSSQEENKSLPLAHENRDHRLLQPHKDQDQELKNSFKSYFKSTHCQSFENFGTIMSHQEEDDAGASLQLQIRPINFLNSHEHLKNNILENENCYNMVLSKKKEGVALHSPTRQNKNNNENVESLELYERKEIGHKNDTMEDLWITRFSPKSIVSDHLTERGGFQTTSTYCSMLTEKHISHLNNCKVEETKEQSGDNKLLSEAKSLKNCCIDKEASICPKVEKKNNDHISKYKVNHVKPFKRLRNSEPMVSMFARRLGAIKQCQQNYMKKTRM